MNEAAIARLHKGDTAMNDKVQTDDVHFSCTACHISVDEDAKESLTACRLCGKLHCESCVDEYGRCVTCGDAAEASKT
jgi:hypothetical protein